MSMMIPSKASHQRTWDTDDRQLQSFLGLSLWEPEASHPKFGAGITAPLAKRNLETLSRLAFDPERNAVVGDEDGEKEETLLTNRRLAWHFGHMEWAIENVKQLLRKTRGTLQVADIDERFFLAAEGRATVEFVARRVTPLSRAASALEHPLYVQSVPVQVIDMTLPTAKFFTRAVERGLCVLPATLKSAEFYHVNEEDLRLLAPQVIWVVSYRCSTFAIRTEDKLKAAIDEWRPFVDPPLLERLYEREQKSRSYLLGEDVRQLLLGA